jgi:alkylhydroperoxidase family enzyme
VATQDNSWRRLKAGESDERVFALGAWREAPYFTDAERAALALAETVTGSALGRDPVPDEIWDEAARHYGPPLHRCRPPGPGDPRPPLHPPRL